MAGGSLTSPPALPTSGRERAGLFCGSLFGNLRFNSESIAGFVVQASRLHNRRGRMALLWERGRPRPFFFFYGVQDEADEDVRALRAAVCALIAGNHGGGQRR